MRGSMLNSSHFQAWIFRKSEVEHSVEFIHGYIPQQIYPQNFLHYLSHCPPQQSPPPFLYSTTPSTPTTAAIPIALPTLPHSVATSNSPYRSASTSTARLAQPNSKIISGLRLWKCLMRGILQRELVTVTVSTSSHFIRVILIFAIEISSLRFMVRWKAEIWSVRLLTLAENCQPYPFQSLLSVQVFTNVHLYYKICIVAFESHSWPEVVEMLDAGDVAERA